MYLGSHVSGKNEHCCLTCKAHHGELQSCWSQILGGQRGFFLPRQLCNCWEETGF